MIDPGSFRRDRERPGILTFRSTSIREKRYYEFPCSTQVTLSLTFNGVSYDISPADFNVSPSPSEPLEMGAGVADPIFDGVFFVDYQLGQVTRSSCIGAVFGVTQSSNSPSWIVGTHTFLLPQLTSNLIY